MLDKDLIKDYMQNADIRVNTDGIAVWFLFGLVLDIVSLTVSGYNLVYFSIFIPINVIFFFIFKRNERIMEKNKKKYCLHSAIVLLRVIISSFIAAYSALFCGSPSEMFNILLLLLAVIIVGIVSFIIFTHVLPKLFKYKIGITALGAAPAAAIGTAVGMSISRTTEGADEQIVILGYVCLFLSLFVTVIAMYYLSKAYLFKWLEDNE